MLVSTVRPSVWIRVLQPTDTKLPSQSLSLSQSLKLSAISKSLELVCYIRFITQYLFSSFWVYCFSFSCSHIVHHMGFAFFLFLMVIFFHLKHCRILIHWSNWGWCSSGHHFLEEKEATLSSIYHIFNLWSNVLSCFMSFAEYPIVFGEGFDFDLELGVIQLRFNLKDGKRSSFTHCVWSTWE